MRRLLLPILFVLALAAAGCGSDGGGSAATTGAGTATVAPADTSPSTATQAQTDPALDRKPEVEVPDGPAPKKLKIRDIVEGTGAEAKPGDVVTVDYVGVLYKNGRQFDASWDRNEPFTFPLGVGQVIPGWDQGVAGMKVGGRRELIIPPDLGYGTEGSPPVIPPNAPLIFVVDLRAVEPAG